MVVGRGADHLSRERVRAGHAGRDLSAPVAVTQSFSSPGRYPGAVVRALERLGITDMVVDEEFSGDGYWFVAAFTTCLLTVPEAGSAERQMEQIAQASGAKYNGWWVTLTFGEDQQVRRSLEGQLRPELHGEDGPAPEPA